MILLHRITAHGLLALALLAGAAAVAAADPADCALRRAEADARTRAEGRIDPRHHRSAASPWLRRSPFLAAELERALETGDAAATRVVVETMAGLDAQALAREVGPAAAGALEGCRRAAVDRLLARPERLVALADEAVPDGYSPLRRLLGVYRLARPFLRAGAERWRARERSAIAAGVPRPLLVHAPEWPAVPSGEVARRMAALRERHPLGWPVPGPADLEELGAAFAPELATAGDRPAARIGRLWGRSGAPEVDTATPVAYLEPTLARWGDHVLLQLAYTFWFTERPRTGPLDPYGGLVDGLVWRVTLADDGRPLLWESIHPCGCYYTVFLPADRALRYDAPGGDLEAALVLPGPAAQGRVRLHHTPDTHYARHLEAGQPDWRDSAERARRVPYALRPYAELLEPGVERPPFDEHGILTGTARGERWFLWPSGIRSPGAMRTAGRHATAFMGRRTFERAELLGGRLRPGTFRAP